MKNLPVFEAIVAYKSPLPERREAACKTPIFTSKKGPVLNPHLNWTGSVFPLLIPIFRKLPLRHVGFHN